MENRNIARALAAEFIGTFALVFTIILVVSMYALQADIARGVTFPYIALAHGLILFMMIQTVGASSGGHFNPAVTLSLLSIRKIAIFDAVGYVIVQFAGAIFAALLAKVVIKGEAEAFNYAATVISDGTSLGTAIALEALFTFFLVWAIIGTAINPDGPKEWAPLTISATLALAVLLIAPLTGCSVNPARSFGPALVSGEWGPAKEFICAYVVGPVAGGVLAAQLYSGMYFTVGKKRAKPPSEEPPAVESPSAL